MDLLTPRLRLRRFVPEDFDDFYPLDLDDRVMKYIRSCKPAPESREVARERFTRMLDYYEIRPGLGVFATCLSDSGELIGWTALKDLDGTDIIEIGYRYFFRFWGKGYATEAASALMRYGFDHLGLEHVAAVVHPENQASGRVLQKLGMRYTGPEHYYGTNVDFYESHRPAGSGQAIHGG